VRAAARWPSSIPGDVAYIPACFGHANQNVGDEIAIGADLGTRKFEELSPLNGVQSSPRYVFGQQLAGGPETTNYML